MKPTTPLETRSASRLEESRGPDSHAARANDARPCRARSIRWRPADIAALGVQSDAAIALDVGCCAHTVARQRKKRGIAAAPTPTPDDLWELDGDRLAARRWRLNLSQAQLGKRLGCNASRVCHLESSQSHRVTRQTLDNLADALDCSGADLLRRAATKAP